MKSKLPKAWKRELALAACAVWLLITLNLFFRIPPEVAAEYSDIYETATWVVWMYAAAAMGIKGVENAFAARMDKPNDTTFE